MIHLFGNDRSLYACIEENTRFLRITNITV